MKIRDIRKVTCAIEYFNSYDLDAVFVATNAPKEKRHHRFPLRKVSEVSSGQARTVEEPYISNSDTKSCH